MMKKFFFSQPLRKFFYQGVQKVRKKMIMERKIYQECFRGYYKEILSNKEFFKVNAKSNF